MRSLSLQSFDTLVGVGSTMVVKKTLLLYLVPTQPKRMASIDFRKINVDQYDEDILQEEELYDADPRDPATVLADAKNKAAAVRGTLAKWVDLNNLVL